VVDNYAIVCLDICWCYLCLQNISSLPDAGQSLLLAAAAAAALLLARSIQASRRYCNQCGRHFRICLLENWTDLDKTWQRDGERVIL